MCLTDKAHTECTAAGNMVQPVQLVESGTALGTPWARLHVVSATTRQTVEGKWLHLTGLI